MPDRLDHDQARSTSSRERDDRVLTPSASQRFPTGLSRRSFYSPAPTHRARALGSTRQPCPTSRPTGPSSAIAKPNGTGIMIRASEMPDCRDERPRCRRRRDRAAETAVWTRGGGRADVRLAPTSAVLLPGKQKPSRPSCSRVRGAKLRRLRDLAVYMGCCANRGEDPVIACPPAG